MKISYNYTELITELEADLAEGLLKLDGIVYVTTKVNDYDGITYNAVIDYCYNEDEISKEDAKTTKAVKVSELLETLREADRII